MRRLLLTVVLLLGASACKDDPADVSGTYTLAITNGPNGCNFTNYTVDQTATGIGMVVTQNGGAATAEVQGAAGTYLDLVLGSRIFTGSVEGREIHLRLEGNRMASQGTCDYTVDALADADLVGDSLAGTITYTAVTDQSVDCGSLQGCETIQEFNGSRPPQ